MERVKLTCFLDVLSSWCLVAEDALATVRAEFADRLDYEWRIAALSESLDYTPEQLAFYYRRTHHVSGTRLNPVWLESRADGSKWANLAAEAARSLGCTDDGVRLALARAAMLDGKRIAERDVALSVAAGAGGLDPAALDRAMNDPKTAQQIRASGDEFATYHVEMRPTFIVRNAISDASILSGCWRYDTVAAAIRAQLEDQDKYAAFMAQNPAPASVV